MMARSPASIAPACSTRSRRGTQFTFEKTEERFSEGSALGQRAVTDELLQGRFHLTANGITARGHTGRDALGQLSGFDVEVRHDSELTRPRPFHGRLRS